MSDSQQPANDAEPSTDDPEIAALLDFEPVPRNNSRDDAWTPALQRRFIALLAKSGSPGRACEALGKRRSGIDKLYKDPAATSFRDSWHKAVEIAQERKARMIEAEHAGLADVRPPFVDHRRKHPLPAPAEPEPRYEMSDADKLVLLEGIAGKFMRKVAQEREARLQGRIVAADFYLRQVTVIEMAFDLAACALGHDPVQFLHDLRRGGRGVLEIAETPFSQLLDGARRKYWESQGDPPRPEHPDPRYTHAQDDGPWGSRGPEGFSLPVDPNGFGAHSPPARGYSEEQWEAMTFNEQKAARDREWAENAEEQIEWEAAARSHAGVHGEDAAP